MMISDAVILSTTELAAGPRTSGSDSDSDFEHDVAATHSVQMNGRADPVSDDEPLAPLFQAQEANDFRASWDTVQSGFVDDPQQAVHQADALVARVMNTLAESFAHERAKLESPLLSQLDQGDQGEHASTENLRVALRRYRSFFQRLLSL